MKFSTNDEIPFNKLEGLAGLLCNLSPNQMVILSTVIGFVLGQYMKSDEQESVGNFFMTIGQILITMGTQGDVVERENRPWVTKDEFNDLVNKINNMFTKD